MYLFHKSKYQFSGIVKSEKKAVVTTKKSIKKYFFPEIVYIDWLG